MRLTSKSQYGLLVLRELVRCYRPEGAEFKQLSHLSEITKTSTKYLEQILLPLIHEGILESKRGANGGYRLRIDPEKVNLAETLRLLDGRLMPIPRWLEKPPNVVKSDHLSAFGDVIYQIRDSVKTILESNNLTVLGDGFSDNEDSLDPIAEIEVLNYVI